MDSSSWHVLFYNRSNVLQQIRAPATNCNELRDFRLPVDGPCCVVFPCRSASVAYFGFPFFALVEGDVYEILQEAGHPSIQSSHYT